MMDNKRIPAPQQIYRHFKGNLYQIQCIAKHSETGEDMVVYQALYGNFDFYVRPLEMFIGEVDHTKYPDVKQKYRFEQVNKENVNVQPDTPQETVNESAEEAGICDSDVIKFLDADNYSSRIDILSGMKDRITDDMIDIMSTVIDIDVKPAPVERRYEAFMNALLTRKHYEGTRLRD